MIRQIKDLAISFGALLASRRAKYEQETVSPGVLLTFCFFTLLVSDVEKPHMQRLTLGARIVS